MAFTKEVAHELTIHENGVIAVLQKTSVYEDGEFVAERLHRRMLEPGSDLATEPPRLAAVANAIWTPKVIRDFDASRKTALARVLP